MSQLVSVYIRFPVHGCTLIWQTSNIICLALRDEANPTLPIPSPRLYPFHIPSPEPSPPLTPIGDGHRPSAFVLTSPILPGEPLGRVKMELFADVTPKTAENFRQYCTGENKNPQGRPQGYKGSKFHRVVCLKSPVPFSEY